MDEKKLQVTFDSENLAFPEVKVQESVKHVTYFPEGVCSVQIDFDLDSEGKIHNLAYIRGCNGNLKAIGRLVEGKDAAEIADLLRGNECQMRGTSCADQLAKAIDQELGK
jgi:uncharacterized protein (TIGR03905 family)